MATYRNTNPEGDLFEKVRRYIKGLGYYAKPAAGYSLANGGEFGTFNTYRKTDAFANRALDNIIVKGFNIKNVYMIDNDLSDHNPILADLEVI